MGSDRWQTVRGQVIPRDMPPRLAGKSQQALLPARPVDTLVVRRQPSLCGSTRGHYLLQAVCPGRFRQVFATSLEMQGQVRAEIDIKVP